MASDLFDSEQVTLDEAEGYLDSGVIADEETREQFSKLLAGYRKMIKQSRRLVRFSDRTEEKIKKAHGQIETQQAELQKAHETLSDQAEVLELNVRERTQDLAVAQKKLESLVDRGIALSVERDEDKLLEMILLAAKDLSNADGGTLYLREDENLCFEIMRNDSLDIAMGGTTGNDIPFPPVTMRDGKTGEPNHRNVASHAALAMETVVIDDAYESDEFDFSGTKAFDKQTGYRSQSFLTVPLMPRGGEVIGVLQLLNAKDMKTGKVIPFHAEVGGFVEALASQAAVALDNQRLIESQKQLLDSFIELIAGAIDSKSPYTGGHCARVPELAVMLTKAACEKTEGPFADFELTSDDEWREFRIGAWLHDCGKVTTPEYVVDKATKLETIYNRVHEIRMRFEVLWRDAEITYWKKRAEGGHDEDELMRDLAEAREKARDDFAFIAESNVGGEFMSDARLERIQEIAAQTWERNFDDRLGLSHEALLRAEDQPVQDLPCQENLLADKPEHIIPRAADPFAENPFGFRMDVPKNLYDYGEVYNLSIARGTLTEEERFKINDHIVQTIIMLNQLPLPKYLEKVPEYAGTHHETMIGNGYPRKLTRDEMSVPARIMAIADIFEALTASDRPYKKAKTLSEALKIMSFMRNDQHIDPDLFDLFLSSGAYQDYADRFLAPEQIDQVDIEQHMNAQ